MSNATIETPTPRTDAYQGKILVAEIIKHPVREFEDLLEFARQLEREVTELRKPPPCQHNRQSGWFRNGESEMRCDDCGKKMEFKQTLFCYPLIETGASK